jgi:hypothetical protein
LGIQAGRLFIVTSAPYRYRTCGQSSTPILNDERRGRERLGAWAHASLQYRESEDTLLANVCIPMAGFLAEERQAGFRSLKDTWADTTTPHGRLMLTVLGGLAEFELN